MTDPRPCERECSRCHQWKHHSRFARRKRPNSTVWHFDPVCRDCQQIERNERKNADRALAIVEQRAAARARAAGVAKRFFLVNMNWRALIPVMRAMLGDPDARCVSCGHPFLNERDIQFDHVEPPRHPHDWARHHARNIIIGCGSCNRTKTNKAHAPWLDEQESARLSNERHPANGPTAPLPVEQLGLFA